MACIGYTLLCEKNNIHFTVWSFIIPCPETLSCSETTPLSRSDQLSRRRGGSGVYPRCKAGNTPKMGSQSISGQPAHQSTYWHDFGRKPANLEDIWMDLRRTQNRIPQSWGYKLWVLSMNRLRVLGWETGQCSWLQQQFIGTSSCR